ncbi:hypothetical protein GGS24DRAFT_105183 [Hypoxylon argillaceum]|nr:hypothetical protein GGS24DRAFT_105183 [Hypoxylon argillaceum]
MEVSDSKLPKFLNTPNKQIQRAKKLVATQLGSPVVQASRPTFQGFFSRTISLTLKDGREIGVQYRLEDVDVESFLAARVSLGPIVPDFGILEDEELKAEGVWTYWMTWLPGKMWKDGASGMGEAGRLAVCLSLGRVFSKGCIMTASGPQSSADTVKNKIRPHLEAILASPQAEMAPFKSTIQGFLGDIHRLDDLPLWVSHFDLNALNVLVDDECEVTGLIDWEFSTPLPFGVGFGRIHSLAGGYSRGEFYMGSRFEDAERGFWWNLFLGMEDLMRVKLEGMADVIQLAVMVGTVMDSFYLDGDGSAQPAGVTVKALPRFLTYRIPLVRGKDESPYSS